MNPHDDFDPYVYSSFYSDTIELCPNCSRTRTLPIRFFTLSLFNKTELFESIKELDFEIIGTNTVEILLKSNICFFSNFLDTFQNETITPQKIIDTYENDTTQNFLTEIGDITSMVISFTFISKFEARLNKIKNVYNPKHSCRAGEFTFPFDITSPEIFIDLKKMTLFQRCPILHLNVFVDFKNIYFSQFIKEENYNCFSHLEKKVLSNEFGLLCLNFLQTIESIKYFNEHELEKTVEKDRIRLKVLDDFNREWIALMTFVYQRFDSKNKSGESRLFSVVKELVIQLSRNIFDVIAINMFFRKLLGDGNIINLVKMKHLEFNTTIGNKKYDFNLLLKGRRIHQESSKSVKEDASGVEIKMLLMVNIEATIKQRSIIMGVLNIFDSYSSLVNLEKCKKEFELDVKLTKDREEIMRKISYKYK